jgi:hypothetical protein
MSAVLDLWILWKTFMIIFNGEGAG